MAREIQVTFRLRYNSGMDGHVHVATCGQLDLQSTGFTREEAREHLRQEIGLFLTAAHDIGSLPAILNDAGFEPGVAEPGEAMIRVSEVPLEDSAEDSDETIWISLPLAYLVKKGPDAGLSG